MILLDTSGLLAAIDGSEHFHDPAARALRVSRPRILSPFVLAELDYLLLTRVGQDAEIALLNEVAQRVYVLAAFAEEDVRRSLAIIDQYRGLKLGLADASIVVLAERYDCLDILTLDERHFRPVMRPDGKHFRLPVLDA